MDLLRFAAVGSVDDGKSTLIGRLLSDTRQLFDDQILAIEVASRRRGHDGVDLAFVTDGLRHERDQGITIDVAYRYAASPKRKFIIADCPGHLQYTANMATGASTADLALVVVDARFGLREQTRRHLCIATLLRVRQVIVAINKMDLVEWSEAVFRTVSDEVAVVAGQLGLESWVSIPISALFGDNVASLSDAAGYYHGPSVLGALEAAPTASRRSSTAEARFAVQWVLRHPGGGRSYAGMVNAGTFRVGDDIVVLPSGRATRVAAIETFDGPRQEACAPLSVSISLADELDVARGDLLAPAGDAPEPTTDIEATVCWFGDAPAASGNQYRIKHTTRQTAAVLDDVVGRLDVQAMAVCPATTLASNDIGVVRLRTAAPLVADTYQANRTTGSFILIDPATNATVAAGMIGTPLPGPHTPFSAAAATGTAWAGERRTAMTPSTPAATPVVESCWDDWATSTQPEPAMPSSTSPPPLPPTASSEPPMSISGSGPWPSPPRWCRGRPRPSVSWAG